MARRRFLVDSIQNGLAEIIGPDAAHLSRVLRVEPGQRFEISDQSTAYLAEVLESRKAVVRFQVIEELPPPPRVVPATLAVSLVKFDRFEWILEKATELGVATVAPVISERSEKGLAEAAVKRAERWERILRESAQQSRRLRAPELLAPLKLDRFSVASPYRFLLDEDPHAQRLVAALPEPPARTGEDQLALLTGPEGGWTDRERAHLTASGWKPVSLGPGILRTETAAIAGLAILLHAW